MTAKNRVQQWDGDSRVLEVLLNHGKRTLVDDTPEMRELLSRHKICLHKCYAAVSIRFWGDNYNTVMVHRLIMGDPPEGMDEVDHINHDGLDNRRSNLRWVTHAQNMSNRRVSKNSASGVVGVHMSGGGWQACWVDAYGCNRSQYFAALKYGGSEAARRLAVACRAVNTSMNPNYPNYRPPDLPSDDAPKSN